MGEGRKKGPGGGGNPLNYKVVGNPQPANPKPTTIWVNTDVKITGYQFAAEQPENMQPGEVWIFTGTSSPVAFNAAKKNTVMVYPISAKQMGEDGSLVDVTAKSYQNGEWVEWMPKGALYYNGLQNVEWIEKPSVGLTRVTPTFASDHILLSGGASGQNTISGVVTQDKVDVSGYSALTVEFEDIIVSGNNVVYVQISNIQTDTWDVKDSIASTSQSPVNNSISLDFNAAGSYYICIFAMRMATAKIKRVILS